MGYTLAQLDGYMHATARREVEILRSNAIIARAAQATQAEFKKFMNELKVG